MVFGGTAGGVVVEGLGDTTQRLGTVEGVGEHHLALRLVRAAPTGAQRFRVGGLFVVAEKGVGGGYETEYRWTVPHDRRN